MKSSSTHCDSRKAILLLGGLIAVHLASVAFVAAQGARPFVDEWIYIDAAYKMADTGQFDIAPISFAPAIFEALYGGLVLLVAGGWTGNLIMATAVLAAAAAVALYDLLVRLGVSYRFALLLVGMFLFTTLMYSLTTTYMTDPHAVSLTVIAASLLSRGIDAEEVSRSWLLLGSAFAAAAFLSRPGALAVVAGVVVVAVSRRSFSAVAWTLALPVTTVVTYSLASRTGYLPPMRSDILDRLDPPSWDTTGHVLFLTAITVGVWLIPLGPALLAKVHDVVTVDRRSRWFFIAGALVLLVPLVIGFVPQLGNWLNPFGVFPIDESTVGSRPVIVDGLTLQIIVTVAGVLTWAAAAATLGLSCKPTLTSAEVGLWVSGIFSLVLVLVTQVSFWDRMLDRYVVVILPAVLVSIGVRTLGPELPPFRGVAWTLLWTVAIIGVVLASDGMRAQNSVHLMAESAIARGLEPSLVDGGASWTGQMFGLDMDPEDQVPAEEAVWWRGNFAPGLDPRYVVMLNPDGEDCVIDQLKIRTAIGKNSVALVDSRCIQS